jgi:23S rRNA (pseudouridine1915-N3)-methyltransferase
MKIRIIQIGKNKDKYIEEAVNEFLKRLKGFADLEIVTLKELSVSKTFTKERAVAEESEEILAKVDSDDFLVALDERGKEYSSVEFSKLLQKLKNEGLTVTFVIGGPYGLSQAVKDRANLILSFSTMTFTHQMIRLFLLEQIYRGFCIMLKKEYHNE